MDICEIDFCALVDGVITNTSDAGLPLLSVPICEAVAAVLCNGMPEPDRTKLLAEIVVTINHRINLFQKKQTVASLIVN